MDDPLLELHVPQQTIYEACIRGDVGEIERCLDGDNERSLVNTLNEDGHALLHCAIKGNSQNATELIAVLIANGANVNQVTTREGDSPLHIAMTTYDTEPRAREVAELLLRHGAEPFLRNKRLRSPYDCCIDKGYIIVTTLLDGSFVETPTVEEVGPRSKAKSKKLKRHHGDPVLGAELIQAVMESNNEEIHRCIENGCDMNTLNEHGAGAIHYAITHYKNEKLAIVRTLLGAGGSVNLLDHEKDNVLNLAIKTESLHKNGELLNVVSYLVGEGAKVNQKDLDDKDAFILANERRYDDVVELLDGSRGRKDELPQALTPIKESEPGESEPESGESEPSPGPVSEPEPIDHNKPNEEGYFPIHLAVIGGGKNEGEKIQLIENLTSEGANEDAVTVKEGDTALHLAAENNLLEMVNKLLKLNADCSIKNENGDMPYDVTGNSEIQAILEAAMRRKNIAGKWKKTAKETQSCGIL